MVELALEFGASSLSIGFLFNIIPTFLDSEPFNVPTSFPYPPKTLCFPYGQCHYCGVAHRITKLEDGFELTSFIQLLTVCSLWDQDAKTGCSKPTNPPVKEGLCKAFVLPPSDLVRYYYQISFCNVISTNRKIAYQLVTQVTPPYCHFNIMSAQDEQRKILLWSRQWRCTEAEVSLLGTGLLQNVSSYCSIVCAEFKKKE